MIQIGCSNISTIRNIEKNLSRHKGKTKLGRGLVRVPRQNSKQNMDFQHNHANLVNIFQIFPIRKTEEPQTISSQQRRDN